MTKPFHRYRDEILLIQCKFTTRQSMIQSPFWQNLPSSSSTVSIAKFGVFLIYSHHGKIFHLPQSQSSWQNLHVIWWLEYCWYRVNYKTINLPHLQSSWQSLISSSWTVKRPASTSAAFLITKSADRLIYGQLNRSPASYSTSLIMRMSS